MNLLDDLARIETELNSAMLAVDNALGQVGTLKAYALKAFAEMGELPPTNTPQESTPVAEVTPAAIEPLVINSEWEAVLNLLHHGHENIFVTGEAGCLSGDTIVEINRGGATRKITLSRLHYMLQGGQASGKVYKPNISTRIRSLTQDDMIGLGEIAQSISSGEKLTFTVTTEEGRSIRATGDHRFLTPLGWFRLGELHAGDYLLVDGGQTKTTKTRQERRKPYPYVNVLYVHPFRVKHGYHQKSRNPIVAVPRHRLAFEAYLNEMSLDNFVGRLRTGDIEGLKFVDPSVYHVHHIDGNTLNNNPDNLRLMTNREHLTHHANEGAWKHCQARVKASKIVSIIEYGIEPTYDLTIADGMEPNFLANGIVVHNSGKSTLLNYFVEHYDGVAAILAPTGVAALRVGGSTIHRFFGFGAHALDADDIREVSDSRQKKYKAVDLLIIDEISMVRADMMDAIDEFLRKNGRNRNRPFGGCRLIMFGDLYQLPPVSKEKDERKWLAQRYGTETPYFFHAKVWEQAPLKTCQLTTIFRQKDPIFTGALNAIRRGNITQEHLQLINSRVDERFRPSATDELWLTLTTTNASAEQLNQRMLSAINAPSEVFTADVVGDFDLKNAPTDEHLELKPGAIVMFVRNDPDGKWVNGTLGKVISVNPLQVLVKGLEAEVEPVTWESISYDYDEQTRKLFKAIRGKFIQIPLKLASAITVHKGQGLTFDQVIVDFASGAFAAGQAYVALSRCRTLQGMVLRRPVRERDLIVSDEVKRFMNGEPIATAPVAQPSLL